MEIGTVAIRKETTSTTLVLDLIDEVLTRCGETGCDDVLDCQQVCATLRVVPGRVLGVIGILYESSAQMNSPGWPAYALEERGYT